MPNSLRPAAGYFLQFVGSTYDTGNPPTHATNITFRDEFDSLPTYFSGTGYHSIYINYSPSGMLSEANGMRPNNNSSLGTFINARYEHTGLHD